MPHGSGKARMYSTRNPNSIFKGKTVSAATRFRKVDKGSITVLSTPALHPELERMIVKMMQEFDTPAQMK
jgi:hypothetical protein